MLQILRLFNVLKLKIFVHGQKHSRLISKCYLSWRDCQISVTMWNFTPQHPFIHASIPKILLFKWMNKIGFSEKRQIFEESYQRQRSQEWMSFILPIQWKTNFDFYFYSECWTNYVQSMSSRRPIYVILSSNLCHLVVKMSNSSWKFIRFDLLLFMKFNEIWNKWTLNYAIRLDYEIFLIPWNSVCSTKHTLVQYTR